MENYCIRDEKGRLIDWFIPEVDDDRMYYRVVINREEVYYASSKEEALDALGELMEARDQWNLQETIDKLNNK